MCRAVSPAHESPTLLLADWRTAALLRMDNEFGEGEGPELQLVGEPQQKERPKTLEVDEMDEDKERAPEDAEATAAKQQKEEAAAATKQQKEEATSAKQKKRRRALSSSEEDSDDDIELGSLKTKMSKNDRKKQEATAAKQKKQEAAAATKQHHWRCLYQLVLGSWVLLPVSLSS